MIVPHRSTVKFKDSYSGYKIVLLLPLVVGGFSKGMLK